jgi:hypothetical protein
MLSPVSAIRAGRPRPHYAHPQVRHSQARLGLTRHARLAPVAGNRRLVQPLIAVRRAARSLDRPIPHRPSSALVVLRRPTPRLTWIRRSFEALRAARDGSPAAWRA